MEFKQNERVFVSGDADALYIADYHVRVSTNATVQVDASNRAKKVLLLLDEIDGERQVSAMVMKTGITKINGIQLSPNEQTTDYILYGVDGELYGTVELQLDTHNEKSFFNGTILYMAYDEVDEKRLEEDNPFYEIIKNKAKADFPDNFNEKDMKKEEKTSAHIIRPFVFSDFKKVKELDALSGNDVSQWVGDLEEDCDENDFSWGFFLNGELIGYCTIGYADAIKKTISDYPGYSSDALLLSDVYVKEEYRGNGFALEMLRTIIEKRKEKAKELIFITLLDDKLSCFYKKLGFHWAFGEEYIMVLDK